MKRLLFFFLCSFIVLSIKAQYTQIPDANFETALSSLDDIANDGKIPTENIENITSLNIANKNISNLSGIEDFSSLKKLIANGNSLTSIDLSNLIDLEELVLFENQLTSIDLSNNTQLTEIDFYNNQLTSLDLSQNTSLVNAYVDSNSITSLDCSENTFLKRLDISNNSLSYLNIKNTNLNSLGAKNNANLTCIEVDDVSYAESNFTDIDNGVRFITTDCAYLSIPDVNFEAALTAYDDVANDGQVPIANIENLTILNLDNQNISNLSGIEYFTALTILNANGNSLTTIDVSSLVELVELELAENQISTIDLTNNTKLQRIDFYNNSLSSIDFSKNTLLRRIYIDSNSITEIDLTLNTRLTHIDVSNNSLTYLNIKNGSNEDITSFNASGNTGLTCILASNATYAQTNFTVDAGVVFNTVNCDYTEIPDSNFEAALQALGYDDVSGDGQVPTHLITSITSLNLVNKNISDATGIQSFIALEELNIYSNNLTSLDVNTNTQLQHLRCQNNEIDNLDITNNALLETLICDNNQLSSLDLSQNISLNDINISNNPIGRIDLSNNTRLTVLTAENTNLISLDLSNNTFLEEVSLLNGKLISVNLKSGGNTNISEIYFDNNPNLNCISVDDADNATTNWTDIDDSSVYTVSACSINTYTAIPDTAFEGRLYDLGYDDISGDGQVPTSFIQTITALDLSKSSLKDLTGISDFTSLEVLTVSSTTLTTLNLSGNTVIKEIYAEPSGLETIDVSNMTALEVLHCNQANTSLNNVNLSGATSLRELSLHSNLSLTSLDISTNTALEKLWLYQSSVTSLNTTGATSLKEIYTYSSSLTSLDLSTNTALEKVAAYSSSLTSINTNGALALKELYVYQTSISNIDVSSNTALTTLHCFNNNSLAKVNVTGAIALVDLQCYSTQLESLDVSSNTNLETLFCQNTSLVSLDLRNSNNSNITSFNATGNNDLECIMVDDVTNAQMLFTAIDNGTNFSTTTCGYTLIPDANFEAALAVYDDTSADGKVPTANIETATRLFVNGKSISDLTGIEDFSNLEELYCGSNSLTSLDISNNKNLIKLNAAVNNLTSINLGNNENLEDVVVNRNELTSIDISALSNLTYLSVFSNNLTSINVTNNPLLDDLSVRSNKIETLDISQNQALINLDATECSLSEIDLTNAPNLIEIYIDNNNITALDLSKNPLLKYIFIGDNPLSGYLDFSSFNSLEELGLYNCDITALNIKNGNNGVLTYVDTTGNSNLTCIQVDNATNSASGINNIYYIDNHTNFNEDCGYNFSVSPEAILEGAFELGTGDILMQDNLRNILPTNSPYNNETCEAPVFDVTGEKAVVDWVEIQLRNASDNTQITYTKSALLLRNGQIVDTDGVSEVTFSTMQGDYYIAIAHRNHLTVVSNTTYSFGSTSTIVDFKLTSNVNGAAASLISLSDGFYGIPSGDIDENGQIQNADISNTILQLGISGYNTYDIDMNGQVQNADVNKILQNLGKGEQF